METNESNFKSVPSIDQIVTDKVRDEVKRQVPAAVRREMDDRTCRYGPGWQDEVRHVSDQIANWILQNRSGRGYDHLRLALPPDYRVSPYADPSRWYDPIRYVEVTIR